MRYKEMFSNVKSFISYVKPYMNLNSYMVGIMCIILALELVGPLINKLIIDEVFIGKNIKIIFYIIILQFLLFVILQIFNFSKNYLRTYIGNFLTMNLRKNIFKRIMFSKEENSNQVKAGDVFVIFQDDIFTVEMTLLTLVYDFLFVILNLLFMSMIMITLSWQYFLTVFLVVPLIMINNQVWGKPLMKVNRAVRESIGTMLDFVNEVFYNSKNLKVGAKQKYAQRKFINRNNRMVRTLFSSFKVNFWTGFSNNFIKFLDDSVGLIVGAILVYRGDLSIGAYFALNMYKVTFSANFQKILNLKIDMHPAMVSINRIKAILALPQEENTGINLRKIKGDIHVDEIDFEYTDGEKIFENFSLKIKEGEKIAIVGESGSGKSTLINIILGLYKPQKGQIRIGGDDISSLRLSSYRKRIGIVSQDNFFFSDSLKENILLGSKVSDEKLREIFEICQINEFIEEGSDLEKTHLEANGKNFSGGQKQRMAIARAIARDSDLVILDEATSAIDNITEATIFEYLKKELKDKTVISIAHRLSTIKDSDRIIVLKDGEIVEEGKHDELMKKSGYYSDLTNRKVNKKIEIKEEKEPENDIFGGNSFGSNPF